MAFQFGNRTIGKVGVVGSGQIGPDIALHFSKVLAPFGAPVVVVDIAESALNAGRAKVEAKVQKGVETRAFKPAQADQILSNLTFTTDYEALRGADFVIEAATEAPAIKAKIVKQLEALCSPEAILTSNSSHMEPEVIFQGASNKGRTAVVHYFFPAERNPVVEIVPGAETDPEVTSFLLGFYEQIGKVPIRVRSRYGYAIDPIFEGLLLTSVLLVEEGIASPREVDAIAMRALGLGVGPFTAHNLTGGNPITNHGLTEMHAKLGPWFRSPRLLQDMVHSGGSWEVPKRGEKVEVDAGREKRIADDLTATFYGLCCEVIDAGLTSVADLEMAVEIALVIKPPFASMNEMGIDEALDLVAGFASRSDGFPVGRCLREQAASGEPWKIAHVVRSDRDGIAVLTIRRPRVLNALNANVFDELVDHAARLQNDASIRGVVITGFGTKAFVSGADIGVLAEIETPEQGEAFASHAQRALNAIESLTKPVVCAINGIAFGGGNELALACHARICPRGLRMLAGQPEPNLGIIPGAGGTQRLPRLIGFEKAAALLRTGRPISSGEAAELGLVREVDGDLVETAIALAKDAADGKITLEPINADPMAPPDELPDVDIGHLSRAVDAILCRAILSGARLPLREGLALEARAFGEVCATKDMRIGVESFIEHGPRAKPEFTHS